MNSKLLLAFASLLLAAVLPAATLCNFECPDLGSASNNGLCQQAAAQFTLAAWSQDGSVLLKVDNLGPYGIAVTQIDFVGNTISGYAGIGQSLGGAIAFPDPAQILADLHSGVLQAFITVKGISGPDKYIQLASDCCDPGTHMPEPTSMLLSAAGLLAVLKMKGRFSR